MCKIAYVAAVYNKINKKFQRLKIHTEMYSTNLIFDIVPEVEEPEAEIGFMKPRINCSEQFSKSRKKYKNFQI